MSDLLPPRLNRAPLDPALINGTDPAMLTIGSSGDALVKLIGSMAGYQNTLGVYQIAEDGRFVDPRIVFADTKATTPGSEISLRELYGSENFATRTKLGLFLVANGGKGHTAGILDGENLAFVDRKDLSPGGLFTKAQHLKLIDADSGRVVSRKIYHTTDGDPENPLINSLSKDGAEHTISAWTGTPGEAHIGFEDLRDFDFDDLTIAVRPGIEVTPPDGEVTARIVRFDGIGAGDRAGHGVAVIGDFNGDGFTDLAIGAPHADPQAESGAAGADAGAVYIFYGTDSEIPPVVPVETFDGSNGVTILGAAAGDRFGWDISSAGDVDGDGLADLVVGAPGAQQDGVGATGAGYILHGADLAGTAVLDLADQTAADALRTTVLWGEADGDEAGISVSGANDIDGDGFDDVLLGARRGEAEYASYNGGLSYLVRGAGGGLGSEVALGDLDGTNGFRVEGRAMFDQSGRSVAMLGDVNGNGFADIAISGQDADPNGVANAGEVYVVFGGAEPFAPDIDPGDFDGTDGIIIEGNFANGFFGFGLDDAGDVNGDGLNDIILGAYSAPRADLGPDGAAYVVFGTDQGFPARFDIGDLDGSNGFAMRGPANGDGFGRSVAGVGDVNGDGLDDIAVGARYADRARAEGGGEAYVIFGREDFGATLDLATLIDDDGGVLGGWRIDGALGFALDGGGDVDGDGNDDMLVGEPFDIAEAQSPDGMAGSAYLVFGEPGLGPKLPALNELIAEGDAVA